MISIILCLPCTWEHKTMILNVFILVFIIIKSARCSFVFDALDQESIHMSRYCPKQKYCGEGSHVVCMYYDQNQKFGPRCGNPVKIEVTPKMIQNILANVNEIRSKVATGSEQGKDGEVLPRAYGLMKLEWDKELAFLAQVLANQCIGGREDSCRATDRFPNPSQTIAIIRYKYPNWEYLKQNNTEKGLNEGKLLFALDKFLKSTHELRRTVTKEIIMNCPPFHELEDGNLKYYLNLVRGGATHIGCGVSAYSKYKMDGDAGSLQNNVQIVCNISDAPKIKQAVYKIVPPVTGQGYSKRCGCPRGYKESRSCLCERDLKYQWKGNIQTTNNIQKKKKGLNHRTMEDYEEDSILGIQNRAHDEDNDEEIDEEKLAIIHDFPENKDRPPSTSKFHNAENRPEGKNVQNIDSSEDFSKVTNALVPKNNYINSRYTHKGHDPVIVFTSDTKSKSKDHKSKPAAPADAFEELIFNVQSYGKKETTERALDLVRENIVHNHQHSKQDHDIEKVFNVKPQNNDHDSKHKRLLSILNSLELEINNIKFDNDLQQLFDSRMRKIYQSGLKKANETPSPKTHADQLDKKYLHELRTYLENDNDASVEDEISTLRRMIHHLSKGKHKDYNVNYSENENNLNLNYNHMDQPFDEFHDVHNINNLYEDISRKTALAEHRHNYIKFHDLLNNKHNHRQNNNDNNLHDRSKARNQETFADINARHTILAKPFDHNLDRPGQRTSFDARVQFSQPFNRRSENDELHQMRVRRPNILDMLRISRNQQKPSIYQSGRDTITF